MNHDEISGIQEVAEINGEQISIQEVTMDSSDLSIEMPVEVSAVSSAESSAIETGIPEAEVMEPVSMVHAVETADGQTVTLETNLDTSATDTSVDSCRNEQTLQFI